MIKLTKSDLLISPSGKGESIFAKIDSLKIDISLENIQVGNTLKLISIDNPNEIYFEKVVAITNPKTNDPYFQIKTESYDYDFQNFFNIIEVIS